MKKVVFQLNVMIYYIKMYINFSYVRFVVKTTNFNSQNVDTKTIEKAKNNAIAINGNFVKIKIIRIQIMLIYY